MTVSAWNEGMTITPRVALHLYFYRTIFLATTKKVYTCFTPLHIVLTSVHQARELCRRDRAQTSTEQSSH